MTGFVDSMFSAVLRYTVVLCQILTPQIRVSEECHPDKMTWLADRSSYLCIDAF